MDVESQMLSPYQGQKDRLVVGQRLGGTSRGSEVTTMRVLRPLQSGQYAVSRWTSIWAFYRTRCINVLAVVFQSLAWGGGGGLSLLFPAVPICNPLLMWGQLGSIGR